MDAAAPTTNAGPLPEYRAKLAAGELAHDSAQLMAAERLQDLWRKLRGYDPPLHAPANGFFSRLLRRKPADEAGESRPNGLYLVGEVGRGKSMLMDLFFATTEVSRRKRIHFHRFMQDAHARIHRFRRENPEIDDPIAQHVGYSFPSGHATNNAIVVTVVVLLVWPLVSTRLRLLLVCVGGAWVVVTCADRIFAGAHFLSDVVAGVLLGCGLTAAAYAGYVGWRPPTPVTTKGSD